MRIRASILALGAAILVVAGICVWAAWRNFRQWRELTPKKDPVLVHTGQEYMHIADRIEDGVRDLNDSLSVFVSEPGFDQSNRFAEVSHSLGSWIDSQQNDSFVIIRGPVNYSRKTAEILNHVKLAFEAYRAAAQQVLVATDSATARNLLLENKLSLESQSAHLLDAASLLRSKAEQIGTSATTRKNEAILALLTVLALLALLLICAWFAFRIYKLEVIPLHRRLDEHAAIIEKQKKLAHFGELAAGLAHEIRNPLTAINVRLFTLQRSLTPNMPAHADALVIRNEISRLDRVVSDFLKLARPADPTFVPLTAEPLLREIIDLLGPGLLPKNIKLTLESTVPDRFRGDQLQLKQVLINLVKNASESIDHDGSIQLRSHTGSEVIKGKLTEAVIIEIEDTGPGIPPDVKARLFEPFFSTKESGTGLGLSISWQIVDKHDGMLDFKNKHNTGSIFRIVLPRLKGN
jgi:signal transduction histidine kinase